MPLPRLDNRLPTISTARLPTLEAKAGTTARPRGRAWMGTRSRVALAHGYRCADCGCVWSPSRDQIDHDTPLERGGSNDDANLKPRCNDCHAAKTAKEARQRAGG